MVVVVKELPVVNDQVVLDRELLTWIGPWDRQVRAIIRPGQITITAFREEGIPVEREKFIADLMAKTNDSREEVEAFLDTAGSWADDDQTILTIMRAREEMDRWQPVEW